MIFLFINNNHKWLWGITAINLAAHNQPYAYRERVTKSAIIDEGIPWIHNFIISINL